MTPTEQAKADALHCAYALILEDGLEPEQAAFIITRELALNELYMCVESLRNVRDNYDCDTDAHKYGTVCRCCDAKSAIAAYDAKRGAK